MTDTTTTFAVDNRWSPGNSRATVPATARAAYAARWIDQGGYTPADVVWDRQGFAYNAPADRDELMEILQRVQPHTLVADDDIDRDVSVYLLDSDELQVFVRRAGGYYYVDAWLP